MLCITQIMQVVKSKCLIFQTSSERKIVDYHCVVLKETNQGHIRHRTAAVPKAREDSPTRID